MLATTFAARRSRFSCTRLCNSDSFVTISTIRVCSSPVSICRKFFSLMTTPRLADCPKNRVLYSSTSSALGVRRTMAGVGRTPDSSTTPSDSHSEVQKSFLSSTAENIMRVYFAAEMTEAAVLIIGQRICVWVVIPSECHCASNKKVHGENHVKSQASSVSRGFFHLSNRAQSSVIKEFVLVPIRSCKTAGFSRLSVIF